MAITLRRGILLLAASLAAYALVILLSGGFVIDTPWGTLTSRAAIRPLIAAGLVTLFYALHFRRHWVADVGILGAMRWPPIVAIGASVLALAIGLSLGPRIAAGPDESGYVSQAALLARGELTQPVPVWLGDATWNNAAGSAAPVGYVPAPQRSAFVPTYPPGLPLLMAGFQLVAGASAVFYVVPLLGATLIVATWLVGRALVDGWTGAIAAVLVLTSPAFLQMLLEPMSDVPAAGLWTLSAAAALSRRSALAGLAAGTAILVRPNTAPLAIIPMLLVALDGTGRRAARLARYAMIVVVCAMLIAALNRYYFGSPLYSGYGSLSGIFGREQMWTNAEHYSRWFVSSQTPLPLLCVLAPAVMWRSKSSVRTLLMTLVLPCSVLALYLPYQFVMPDQWGYLRFLLPAYPSVMIGFVLVVRTLCQRAIVWPRAATATSVFIVSSVGLYGLIFAEQNHVFGTRQTDQRYERAVTYAQSLPRPSILISLAHSGTLHFYAKRDVLRFDAVDNADIDVAIADLEGLGYGIFFVGDPFEADLFEGRFVGTRAADRMRSTLCVELGGSVACDLGEH